MRERIRVDRLEIGMYVESLCGKWIDHPFWRTRFLIRDERDLASLRASGVDDSTLFDGTGLAAGVVETGRYPPTTTSVVGVG